MKMYFVLLGGANMNNNKKRNSTVLVPLLVGLLLYNFSLSAVVISSSARSLITTTTNTASNSKTAGVSLEQQQQQQQSQPGKKKQQQPKVELLSPSHQQQQVSQAADQSKESNNEQRHPRRLEFVHIPQTGAGTAIERVALERANITWGANHFVRRPLSGVPYWHFPPRYFSSNNFDPHGATTTNPYSNASLFTVVRNPYDRIVSEYLSFSRAAAGSENVKHHNDEEKDAARHAMNEWLSSTLRLILRTLQMGVDMPRNETIVLFSSNNQKEHITITTWTMDTSDQWNKTQEQGPDFKKGYYIYNGHYIPQFDYVYDGAISSTISSSDGDRSSSISKRIAAAQPVVDHVLHFENLHEEFVSLMTEYGLEEIRIPLLGNPSIDENRPKNSTLSVADLSEANRRLIEAIYARDFAAFGYEILAPRPDVAAKEAAAAYERRHRNDVHPGLEFVHIPKTGGTAVEKAAKKQNIPWGANNFNDRPREQRRIMGAVPLWHMPPHYFQGPNIMNATDAKQQVLTEFDPYGPSPYINATALFTIVRNPYARVVSEYLFYHREVKRHNVSMYNNAQQMNAWISGVLLPMARVLQPPEKKLSASSSSSSKNKYTIDTAGHWNKPSAWTKAFIKPYFNCLGHFIPQYDYVYDTDLPLPDDDDEGQQKLPPPPKPVIQHVLHFENLHEEFAALMVLYNLSHVVLPDPHAAAAAVNDDTTTTTANKTQSEQSSSKKKKPNLVGVANLTDSSKRLIEKVYARDFAAFGYEMMI